jgi:glutamate/tyrosine decarboxylase-like PLP-dependent enzyme
MGICRDASAMANTMTSDPPSVPTVLDAQRNLTLEFSRRARGISIWAALRALGRSGIAELVERHCMFARRLAEGLSAAGLEVLNRVVLNQVLFRARDDAATAAMLARVQAGGQVWFGPTRWQGRAACRLSVSSWRTTSEDIERTIAAIAAAV